MADELPQEAQSNLIDALASRQMGVEPQQPQAPEQAPAEPAEAPETAEEKAVDEGSPETESEKMSKDAVLYEIEMEDGTKQMLSPNQIAGLKSRYAALNYKNAEMKPIHMVVEAAIKNGLAQDPTDAARQLINLMKADEKNPQMGDTDGKTNVQASEEMSRDSYAQWEEDNAVSLPPGYREQADVMRQVLQQNNEMRQMMARMLQQGEAAADGAAKQAIEAQNMKGQAAQQMINNNLDKGADRLGLTDANADDFKIFAQERGYTEDDFIDPGLTLKVMTDFKNAMDSEEMVALRDIHKRRQAFTGTLAQTPQAGGAVAEPAPEVDPTLGRLTDRAMG